MWKSVCVCVKSFCVCKRVRVCVEVSKFQCKNVCVKSVCAYKRLCVRVSVCVKAFVCRAF